MKKQASGSGIAPKSQLARVKEVEHDADSDIGEKLVQPKMSVCCCIPKFLCVLQYICSLYLVHQFYRHLSCPSSLPACPVDEIEDDVLLSGWGEVDDMREDLLKDWGDLLEKWDGKEKARPKQLVKLCRKVG